MPVPPALVFLAGLIVLVVGSEMLLRGATRIAALLGVRPIVIGLTVVSVGTSMPELAVGVTAAADGRGALAVGNIAGTNIVNILLILGLSAALRPLPMHLASIRLDVPAMILTALALLAMAWNGVLGRVEGLILLAAAVPYTIAVVRISRHETADVRREFAQEYGAGAARSAGRGAGPGARLRSGAWHGVLLVAGMAVTVYGAELLVSSAARIAVDFGVSDAFIGLTIVAIGTSAPELATTLVATIRDDRDVAIGNLIGSSVYNVLVILGMTCVLSPADIDVGNEILWIDLPIAAAVAIVCYPVFRSGQVVSRREGIAFVVAYAAYLASLIVLRT